MELNVFVVAVLCFHTWVPVFLKSTILGEREKEDRDWFLSTSDDLSPIVQHYNQLYDTGREGNNKYTSKLALLTKTNKQTKKLPGAVPNIHKPVQKQGFFLQPQRKGTVYYASDSHVIHTCVDGFLKLL